MHYRIQQPHVDHVDHVCHVETQDLASLQIKPATMPPYPYPVPVETRCIVETQDLASLQGNANAMHRRYMQMRCITASTYHVYPVHHVCHVETRCIASLQSQSQPVSVETQDLASLQGMVQKNPVRNRQIFSRMEIYFLPYIIFFSPVWKFFFSRMEIFFLPYGNLCVSGNAMHHRINPPRRDAMHRVSTIAIATGTCRDARSCVSTGKCKCNALSIHANAMHHRIHLSRISAMPRTPRRDAMHRVSTNQSTNQSIYQSTNQTTNQQQQQQPNNSLIL